MALVAFRDGACVSPPVRVSAAHDASRRAGPLREVAEASVTTGAGGISYVDMIMLDYPGPDCESIRGQWKARYHIVARHTTRAPQCISHLVFFIDGTHRCSRLCLGWSDDSRSELLQQMAG